jgi:hypothetical protein
MILALALRSLMSRPVRSLVLAGGFGFGVAVMAALLGIGGVILEQARAPQLSGGGDVVISGPAGRVHTARFILSSVLANGPLAPRVAAASPVTQATLYVVDARGPALVHARGSVPGLERAVGNDEARDVPEWTDSARDREWASPDPADVLRGLDRFHAIPDVPARAASWAEWLYFNGRAGTARFYLTFLAGPRRASGTRTLGIRLQLERGGILESFSDAIDVSEAALATAPDITAGGNSVRLDGLLYRIRFDLPAESGKGRATGDITLTATPGRSMPPFELRGAGGWVSGYVVPVISGPLSGAIRVRTETIDLDDGAGYHDHNWGFWEGVRWQWGQVHGSDVSFVYGRVYPPRDAADATRVPGFLVALGPDGPVGYATDVAIEESNDATTNRPRSIVVRAQSESLALTMTLDVEQTTATRMRVGGFGAGMDFLQMRARYDVSGRVGGKDVAFTALGSAETFRGK